jgi:hypothetical protein
VFFTIIMARTTAYPNIIVLSQAVSTTMVSTSFEASLGTALSYTISVSNVELVANSPSDPSVSPTHIPTPLPTLYPTPQVADKGQALNVVLFAGIGLGVAVLFVVLILYFKFYKQRVVENKKWQDKEKDQVLANLAKSQNKAAKSKRGTKNVMLNEGGDLEEDVEVGMLEMKSMSMSTPPPAPSPWSSQNLAVKVEYKKELRIFTGQDGAFTPKGDYVCVCVFDEL